MSSPPDPLVLVTYLLFAAFVVGVVACALRRWRLAATVAGSSLIAGLVLCVVMVARSVVVVPDVDPSMKATMLAAGIPEAVNCAVITLIGVSLNAVVWRVARRRLRATGKMG